MKQNPRRKPATLADLKRAKQAAFTEAVDSALALFLTVLYDKEHAQIEDIQRIGKEVRELSESVIQGYVSIADLKNVLKTEYGVELK